MEHKDVLFTDLANNVSYSSKVYVYNQIKAIIINITEDDIPSRLHVFTKEDIKIEVEGTNVSIMDTFVNPRITIFNPKDETLYYLTFRTYKEMEYCLYDILKLLYE